MNQPATTPHAPSGEPAAAEGAAALRTPAHRPPIWPRPGRTAPPVVLAAAVAAGLTAAFVVPLGRLGLGWPITASVLFGLGALIVRRAPAADRDAAVNQPDAPAVRPGKQSKARWTALWTALALALLVVTAVRAAEWLGVLCLLCAAVAGSLAVAGGRSTRGLLLGAVAVPALAVGALPWAGRGVRALHRRGGPNPPRLLAAVLVSAALLAVFVPLLAGADAAFDHLVRDLIPTLSDQTIVRTVLFTVFALSAVGAGYLLLAPARPDPVTTGAGRLRRVEWALPVGLLVALFTTFVVVSLATLFGGAEHVLRTTGLTSAEYARGGFWQLLLVSLLTLPVIMVAGRYAATTTSADRVWLRGLLGGLAVLTLVIVASALSRMWAYQQAYGFTVLRVLVSAMELWLGGVYLMVLGAGRRLRAPWLPRAVVGSGLIALLVIGAANPDRFIAERNIDRWQHSGVIDVDYLRDLSADVVPALERLPEPLRDCVLGRFAVELAQPESPRSWNLGRSLARARTAGWTGGDSRCTTRP